MLLFGKFKEWEQSEIWVGEPTTSRGADGQPVYTISNIKCRIEPCNEVKYKKTGEEYRPTTLIISTSEIKENSLIWFVNPVTLGTNKNSIGKKVEIAEPIKDKFNRYTLYEVYLGGV